MNKYNFKQDVLACIFVIIVILLSGLKVNL